jgi:HEAT repeat protein
MLVLSPRICWLTCLAVPILAGCAKGPMWRLGGLSPWVQQQWAEEEKTYGATLHTKLSELDGLVARAGSMQPEERENWAGQLARLAISDPSPLLRTRVVAALPSFPSPASDAALRTALTDKDLDVRVAACEAWGRRGGSDAVQLLSERVSGDADTDVRLAAIRALGQLDDQQTASGAVRALGVALEDKNPAIQFRAIESLRGLSGRDYGTDLVAWRQFVQGGQPAEPAPTIADRLRNWF